MIDIFDLTTRPKPESFFRKNDENDVRLGEIVSTKPEDYAASEIVILACPQDEGVKRNGGRTGAALAPEAIRAQFYKLTNFEIGAKIFDLGDTIIQPSLEATHDAHTRIARQILEDGKTIIILGGGNDVSYADGRAMSEIFGANDWIALNIDAHFDVRGDALRNSGTPYRQLLEENLIAPQNFHEIAWQAHGNSPVYFEYLKSKGVNLLSLEEFRDSDLEIQDLISKNCSPLAARRSLFFGFDVDAVRASDAPGVSAASPIGLTAEEFVGLAKLAGENERTKIIEFTEMNPNYDIDNRTAKLVAVAMHRFCRALSGKQKS